MKVEYDEILNCNIASPDCVEESLQLIWDIGADYDGASTVEGLKNVIDELVSIASDAREFLKDGHIYASEDF